MKSPNHETKSKAWFRLHEWGTDAENALAGVWNSDQSVFRVRALWLLTKIDGILKHVESKPTDSGMHFLLAGLNISMWNGIILLAATSSGSNQALTFLRSVVLDESKDLRIRQQAIEAFGYGSWNSEDWLLEMARD